MRNIEDRVVKLEAENLEMRARLHKIGNLLLAMQEEINRLKDRARRAGGPGENKA